MPFFVFPVPALVSFAFFYFPFPAVFVAFLRRVSGLLRLPHCRAAFFACFLHLRVRGFYVLRFPCFLYVRGPRLACTYVPVRGPWFVVRARAYVLGGRACWLRVSSIAGFAYARLFACFAGLRSFARLRLFARFAYVLVLLPAGRLPVPPWYAGGYVPCLLLLFFLRRFPARIPLSVPAPLFCRWCLWPPVPLLLC